MQMHQLDKRIRKMLEVLEDFRIIQAIPVEGIQYAVHGQDDWKQFDNGSFWSENGQEWVDFRTQCTYRQGSGMGSC